jgi:hypothetical protein
VSAVLRYDAEMKTRGRDAYREKEKTKDPGMETVGTLKEASREERRREAGKPLYLLRYE